jgi:hypothetical protein
MTQPTLHTSLRELDHRTGDGIDVTLLWDSVADQVLVTVHDTRSDELFELRVRRADALFAFHHPYAYANPVSARADLVRLDDPWGA